MVTKKVFLTVTLVTEISLAQPKLMLRAEFLSLQKLLAAILLQKKKSVIEVLAAVNILMRIPIIKIVCGFFLS